MKTIVKYSNLFFFLSISISLFSLLSCEKIEETNTIMLESQLSEKFSLSTVFSTTPDIIVNTTSDLADFCGEQQISDLPGPDGIVSLQEAIIAARNTSGPHVIHFNIPTSDPGFDGTIFMIQPLTSLWIFGEEATIDGTSQAIFSGNTNSNGPEIMIEGSLLAADANCLYLHGTKNILRGFVISGSPIVGVCIQGDENTLENCFIGTDATGLLRNSNASFGVAVSGENHLIKGNLISGNNDNGLVLSGNRCKVERNKIGTDVTGTNALPNGPAGGTGVSIAEHATNNIIMQNLIAFNLGTGVAVTQTSFNNTILHNSIFSNNGLGIDLGVPYHGDGVTPNDSGDTDTGPNNLMNFPVLTFARATPGRLIVKGYIDTPNPKTVIVEFFANPASNPGGDPSGHGEGAIYLGSKKPNEQGKFTAPLHDVALGTLITATATDINGNTSEFAANIEVR